LAFEFQNINSSFQYFVVPLCKESTSVGKCWAESWGSWQF